MEETGLSRRHLLAAAGSLVTAGAAGCVMRPPEEVTASQPASGSSDFGEFPDQLETPAQQPEGPEAEGDAAEVYEAVVSSVAAVEVATEQGPAGGSAWVYEDSYLVTNEHVIAGGTEPYVWFVDIGWREATVVGTDIYSDLAVLEVSEKPESAQALPLVDEPKAVGTPVAAVGNPFDLTGSLTTGVISGRNRNIRVPGTEFSIADGIQTDAALNPGNSGGPLVTYDGGVVGVVSAGQGENIGFAISAGMVNNVVPELIEHGEYEHSHMGIRLLDVRPALIEANDLPVSWGVYVHDVVDGGPSDGVLQGTTSEQTDEREGVFIGGDVIVEMGDWTIHDQERLSAFLALETEPGDTIEIEVVRDGERETVDLTLGARPDIDDPIP